MSKCNDLKQDTWNLKIEPTKFKSTEMYLKICLTLTYNIFINMNVNEIKCKVIEFNIVINKQTIKEINCL